MRWRVPYSIPRTCCAVSLRLGSASSICLTSDFALSETLGQGSLLKSMIPRSIACATPCSDSVNQGGYLIFRNYKDFTIKQMEAIVIKWVKSHKSIFPHHLPKMEEIHIARYIRSLLHSIHLPLVHNFAWEPLEPCNRDSLQSLEYFSCADNEEFIYN